MTEKSPSAPDSPAKSKITLDGFLARILLILLASHVFVFFLYRATMDDFDEYVTGYGFLFFDA